MARNKGYPERRTLSKREIDRLEPKKTKEKETFSVWVMRVVIIIVLVAMIAEIAVTLF